MKLLLKHVDQA